MEGTNGQSPNNPFASAIEDLQSFIAEQKRKEDELRRQLHALQDETRKATRALEILSDRKANESPRQKSERTWVPRKKKMDAVLGAMSDEPQTITQIATGAGVSNETVRRALDHLRIEERVRMTGVIRAGRSNQRVKGYALMPTNN